MKNDGIDKRLLFSEEYDQDNFEDLKKEYSSRKLHLTRYDRMICDIVKSVNDKKYILDPDFQRNFVWDLTKCSKLIESILINVPIPSIYASEESDVWIIVDGVQRLTALQKFYNNEFKLKNLEILNELNDKCFNDLPEKYKNILDRGNISVILLESDTSPNIKFDIFMRLNTGGEALEDQELRNCLYRGKLNDALKNEMSHENNYRKLLYAKGSDLVYHRMEDIELVLRFIALYNDFNYSNVSFKEYTGNLKRFLNRFMENNKNCNDDYILLQKQVFKDTLNKVLSVYEKDIFFKYNGRFNKSIFDMVMLCFANLDINNLDKKTLRDKTYKLFNDDNDFIETLRKSTSSKKNIITRIIIFKRIIDEIK